MMRVGLWRAVAQWQEVGRRGSEVSGDFCTGQEGVICHFLCLLRGAREHPLIICFVPVHECEIIFVTNGLHPVAGWWRYDIEGILACRCVQGGTLIKHVKFGRDLSMCTEFITTSCFILSKMLFRFLAES